MHGEAQSNDLMPCYSSQLTENLFQEYLANGGESGSGERKNGSMDKIPRPTYRFLAAEPSNIRVSDIPDLLAEYKGLVKTVEGLLNDRRVMEKEVRIAQHNPHKAVQAH